MSRAVLKKCVKCESRMISHLDVCTVCRQNEHDLKVYGCYLPKPEPDWYIRCPECNSSEITSTVFTTVWASFDVNKEKIIEVIESDYPEEINNYFCQKCCYSWEV